MEKQVKNRAGTLFLLPTSIAAGTSAMVIPSGNVARMSDIRHFIVENERTARRYLREAGVKTAFEEIEMYVLNQHTPSDEYEKMLEPCFRGEDTGLLSESGLPCIADPGARIVMLARESGVRIIPLSGPSSVFLALMASGLNGQNFAFNGYLPIEKSELARKIKDLERRALTEDQTQIFIETPYRNQRLFEVLTKTCHNDTLLSIACEITADSYYQDTFAIADWKGVSPEINKRNAVFLLGKPLKKF